MTDLFVQLLDQYDQLREELDQLGEENALGKAQKLLDDIKEAGKLVVDPDERRILSNLAYDLGEIIFNISDFYPSVRLMSTAGEGAWRRLGEATEKAGKLEELEYFYHASRVYLAKEQWEAAIGYLERIVGLDAKYQDAAVLLDEARRQLLLRTLYTDADIRLKERDWTEAIELFKRVVSIDPTYKDAEAKLDQAQTQYRVQALYEQAMHFFSGEEWSRAIESLEEVLMVNPGYRDATAKLHEARKQYELARMYYDAIQFQETDQWAKAINGFEEIIRQANSYKDVAERLARVQRQQEMHERFRLGEDYTRQGKWKQAEVEFARVHTMDPDYQDVQARLEEARRQLYIEELRERGEDSLRVENWQEAVEVLEELRRLDPLDTSVIAKLEEAERRLELKRIYREAMGYVEKGRWRKAQAALERAARLAPDSRDAVALLETVRERSRQSSPVTEALRDPLLQGIGALVAVIVLIFAVYPFAKHAFVNPVTSTPKPPGLRNGTFDGKLECWQHGGELKQSVKCEGGQCYAVLGSPDYRCEGGVPVGEAWIKQSFQVPQTVSPTLSLIYQVFSYDLDTVDFFQVQINGSLVGQFGNPLWNAPSCDPVPWDSGWQALEFDLSPYKGQIVEVLLSNVNGTHKWYNTWTYVDDVQVR